MEIKEGEDYYLDTDGRFVLTESFLKKRGFCCHNNCRHCPYKKVSQVTQVSEVSKVTKK